MIQSFFSPKFWIISQTNFLITDLPIRYFMADIL